MADAEFPGLDPAVEADPALQVDELAQRYEVFEALHHSIAICNPMRSDHLDELIEALAPEAAGGMVDFATGAGEMIHRCSEREAVRATGVDESPWMLNRAAAESRRRSGDRRPRWVLADARQFAKGITQGSLDVATCLGAEWIWYGFGGTVRALSRLVGAEGRIAVGAPRLHHDADPAALPARIETVDDQVVVLADAGLRPLHRIDPSDADWDAYLAATGAAAASWAERFPGLRSERWLAEQADWLAARERDRAIIGWSAWVAEPVPGAQR